jgi:hypothetical protein
MNHQGEYQGSFNLHRELFQSQAEFAQCHDFRFNLKFLIVDDYQPKHGS